MLKSFKHAVKADSFYIFMSLSLFSSGGDAVAVGDAAGECLPHACLHAPSSETAGRRRADMWGVLPCEQHQLPEVCREVSVDA